MPRYRVVNDNDPNDFFELEAQNDEQAAFFALSELGWCGPNEIIEDDEE